MYIYIYDMIGFIFQDISGYETLANIAQGNWADTGIWLQFLIIQVFRK